MFVSCAITPLIPSQIVTERIIIKSSTDSSTTSKTSSPCPSYALDAQVVRTASGGKALLGKDKHVAKIPYSHFFDSDGVLDQESFEAWVNQLVTKASATS
jgi:hypothetical protein